MMHVYESVLVLSLCAGGAVMAAAAFPEPAARLVRGIGRLWGAAFPLAGNPLLRDPFCARLRADIAEARRRHKPVRHLKAQLEARLDEILGEKGRS